MAKINDWKFAPKKAKTVGTTDVKNTETVTTVPNEAVEPSQDLSAIMARLDRLEKENAELKKVDVPLDPKARNQEPRRFNYQLWWGVPVLSSVSKRRDGTKELQYKNWKGIRESNHNVVLSLSDGTETEVDAVEYWKFHTKSEKMEATDENGNKIMLGMRPNSYTFETEHWKIEVLPSNLN